MLVALIHGLGAGLLSGRLGAFLVAVSVTWALNRRLTFAGRTTRAKGREYGLYVSIQSVGAVINILVYGVALLSFEAFRWLPWQPVRRSPWCSISLRCFVYR